MLLTHITIALISIVCTTLTYVAPSKTKLRISYSLVALTLGTGTWLVISTGSPLLHSCITGLLYLSIVSAGIIAAQHKLKESR